MQRLSSGGGSTYVIRPDIRWLQLRERVIGGTICAERNAIGSMVAAGCLDLRAIVIYTPTQLPSAPCGICRQVLNEFEPIGERLSVIRLERTAALPKCSCIPCVPIRRSSSILIRHADRRCPHENHPMEVQIVWEAVRGENDHNLDATGVLYAYLEPDTKSILYIGKADRASVWERSKGRHKEDVYRFLSDNHQIDDLGVIVGQIVLAQGGRLTSELLGDIESLLIKRLQPMANIQSTQSRISRPGMRLFCLGDWPHRRSRFIDRG